MEFIVRQGKLTERSIQELAEWYAGDDAEPVDFETHLLLLKAHSTLVSSALRGRRTLLGVERFALLRLLYRQPGNQMQMTEIGRALDVSPTSITKLVNRLVALKLVERIPHERDRRRSWVRITDKGVALVAESLPTVRETTHERWKGLTVEEKRMLAHLLARFVMTNQTNEPD